MLKEFFNYVINFSFVHSSFFVMRGAKIIVRRRKITQLTKDPVRAERFLKISNLSFFCSSVKVMGIEAKKIDERVGMKIVGIDLVGVE